MFDPFTMILIGGAIGGLLDKKDPLRGALLGGAMGYGGGLLAAASPATGTAAAGFGTGTAATGLGTGTSVAGLNAGGGGLMTSLSPWLTATATGTPAQIAAAATQSAFDTAMGYMKPAGQALQAANQVQALMPKDKPFQITPSPLQTPMPNSALGNMVAAYQQEQANKLAMEKQLREMRKQRGLV
jgi:hypothetical protein